MHGDCLRYENASSVSYIDLIQIWYKMFDYFRNFSQQCPMCCEDSPTIGLYNPFALRWPWPSITVTTASQSWHIFNSYSNSDSNISDTIPAMAFKHGMTVHLCMAYVLMLVSMTLTLMQGHSRSAKAQNRHWVIHATQASYKHKTCSNWR